MDIGTGARLLFMTSVGTRYYTYWNELLTRCTDRFFEYGCLYDLTVEALPSEQVTIVQILREQPFPTYVASRDHHKNQAHIPRTLCAGSSILLLAQLCLDTNASIPSIPKASTHIRQRSDDLMEDLEFQLGSSTLNYMQVRVSYSHSGFPEFCNVDTMAGVSNMCSRMETTATACLKRHNMRSPWSPPPAPTPNPLFQLIERHWGPQKATEAMHQILTQRSTPRKPARAASRPSLDGQQGAAGEGRGGVGLAAAPFVPVRQTSLQTPIRARNDGPPTMRSLGRATPGVVQSPSSAKTTSTATSGSSYSCKTGPRSSMSRLERFRNEIGESPLGGKRRSLGAEALRSLVPMLADNSPDSRERDDGRGLRGGTVRVRGKKDSGLWNWGNWF